MRICFVDPKGIHFGLNTGIGYLVSAVKGEFKDATVKVFDFNNNLRDFDGRVAEIAGYDVIGFSIKSFTKDNALSIARRVKTPKNVLVAGGPHATIDGVNFLKEHEEFSCAVVGEGEKTVVELLKALSIGGGATGIGGVVHREGGAVVMNGRSGRITDLDSLAYPDYSVFDSVADGRIHNYPLVTSRGCPYPCTYCCVKDVIGAKWNSRSVESIIGELAHAVERYRIDCFNIQDDNFTLDMDRARAFCDALTARGPKLRWSCPNGIRADRVDDDLMGRMRAAGCFAVAMGIESGVEEEFNAIKKGERLTDVVEAVRLAKKHGVWVFGNFIIGLPGATLKSVRESVRFARRMDLESCIFNLIVPFPGTEVWGWARKNGRMLMDWKDGFTQGKNPKVVFETDEFLRADRIRAYWEANVKCHNYFACMDEHDSLLSNMLRVAKAIVAYDPLGLPRHLLWCLRHAGRIAARMREKNA